MARIKRRKLKWKASDSSQVIGYKLYWAKGGGVNYDSEFEFLGNVTEIILPDGIKTFPIVKGTIELGVTALNEIGNESDMIKCNAYFQFSIPDAPEDLVIERADGHYDYEESTENTEQFSTEFNSIEIDEEDSDFNLFKSLLLFEHTRVITSLPIEFFKFSVESITSIFP